MSFSEPLSGVRLRERELSSPHMSWVRVRKFSLESVVGSELISKSISRSDPRLQSRAEECVLWLRGCDESCQKLGSGRIEGTERQGDAGRLRLKPS